MYPRSFNSALVATSAAVTGISFLVPAMLSYAMDPELLAMRDWTGIALRILPFQFLHGWFLHLLGNGFFLLYFGGGIERSIGTARYVMLFAFSTALVTLGVLFFSGGPTIGISGFVMAVLAYWALRMKERNNPEYKSAFFFIFLNVAFGLVGNVSLVGHAAGAIAGAAYRVGERFFDKR